MERSEERFKAWVRRYFGETTYIHKMADYRQLGHGSQRGLPDFLVITSGDTMWFEVKLTKSSKTFNLNDIRDSQWIEFKRMTDAGAEVYVGIYFNTRLINVAFDKLWEVKFKEKRSSVSLSECENAEAFCE